MWQILLWWHMPTPKHYPSRKWGFYKGQNWDINGRYLGRTRFVQLLWAYMAGLDWETLEKYIHRSTEPVILDLWLACEPCQTITIKFPHNVAYLLPAGDNSVCAVKHRPRKHSALLNGAWTPCVCWSTFWKSNLKWKWVCKFDIMENNFFIVFSCDQAALRTLLSVHPSVRPSVCQFSHFRTVTPILIHIWQLNVAQSLMLHRRGALLFFKIIPQISRSHGTQNHRFWPELGISGL